MEKREAIIDAAQGLFARRGVEAVSIEAIAAASGVSKVTVYSHFGDKFTIFQEMMEREAVRLGQEVTETSAQDATLEERLNHFGIPLLTMICEPCHVALSRMLSIEAIRSPEIGQRFFQAGPGRTKALMVSLLDEARARGEIDLADPDRAAEDLLSLWLGFLLLERTYLPQPTETDTAALAEKVRRGTSIFLRAYAKMPG